MPLRSYRNIDAWIYMNDHCDPHVTFDCPADAWKARIRFSMVKADISLVDVKPMRNAPTISLLNRLAKQLEQRLDDCRMTWWLTKGGELCIDSKSVERVAAGRVLLDGRNPNGKIIPRSGKYLAQASSGRHEVIASVAWTNGTITHNEVLE